MLLPGFARAIIALFTVQTNTVIEKTSGNGVNVDGTNIKDGGATLKDSVTTIVDDGDPTKKLAFSVGGVATATTRTVTVPDANTELGKVRAANMFTSTEQTGTGAEQLIAHGLGATPTQWWHSVSLNKDLADCSFARGVADTTNCKMTVTTGAKFHVFAVLGTT